MVDEVFLHYFCTKLFFRETIFIKGIERYRRKKHFLFDFIIVSDTLYITLRKHIEKGFLLIVQIYFVWDPN